MQDWFIYTTDDVLLMLDALLADGDADWNDENLVAWFGEGLLTPGRVLELGCGHGRNATYLAGLACGVDAVDLSAQAIEWAQKRAKSAGVSVEFQYCSICDATFTAVLPGRSRPWA
jgi:2-polyprenyl-3-methyl-5-hydroxy-6-metoxy-1,4-benzoquinol methylase